MRSCFDRDELGRLAARAPEDRAADDAAHLRACARCRARIDAQRADDALFESLQRAVRDREDDRVPFHQVIADRFEVLEEVQRGGQGIVYRARERQSGQLVAIKLLVQQKRGTLRDRYRFERETELVARLRHPNIVSVRESAVAHGHFYCVMDWIDGRPLDRFVAEDGPELPDALSLFCAVCDAVAHAHRRGVIHRDLKPGNILVDATGAPRVLDFGLAKDAAYLNDDGVRITRTGEFVGTLAYASPEQLGVDSEAVDTRTDVYSLGVILHELANGRPPYELSGSVAEVLANIQAGEPAFARGLDADLRTILLRALNRDPDRRYPSVTALADDVRRYLRDEPIEARRDSTGYVLRKWLRRHRRAVTVAAGFALVLGGSIAALVGLQERESRQRLTSLQVRELFQESLAAASPEQLGGNATMPEFLEATAQRLQHTLPDAPEVRAALRLTIGETYSRLRMMEVAEPHLRAALALYREVHHGSANREVARCLDLLGLVLSERRRADAVACHEEALEILTRLEVDEASIALTKSNLALALAQRYRHPDRERAAALYAEALSTLRRAHGDEHLEVARTLARQTRLLAAELDDDELEQRLLGVLAIARRNESRDGAFLLERLNDYSWFLQRRGRHRDAGVVFAEAQERMRRAFGAEQVPDLLWRMARFELRRGELAAAEQLHRKSLVARLGRWRQTSPEHLHAVDAVVTALESPGGEPFGPCLALLLEFEGPGAYELAGLALHLAELRELQGRPSVAEALLRDSLAIHCREFGMDCPHRAANLHALGHLLSRREAWSDAVPFLRESLEIRRRVGAARSLPAARTAVSLAAALIKVGDGTGAESLLREAEQVVDSGLAGAGATALEGKIVRLLADLYRATERPELAAGYERRAAVLEAAK